jgi:hypothetical protein
MQTLILNSPIPGPLRPGILPSDTSASAPLTGAFADHLAVAPDVLPQNDMTEPLAVPEVLATAPESMPPGWLGRVSPTPDPADPAIMAAAGGDGGLPTPEISLPIAPPDEVFSSEALPAASRSLSEPFGLMRAGFASLMLPAQVPQGVALATRGHATPGMSSLDHPEPKQSGHAGTGLPLPALSDGAGPPVVNLPVAPSATNAGWEKLGSKVHRQPDAGSQQLSVNDTTLSVGTADRGTPRAELLRGVAVASSEGDGGMAVPVGPAPLAPGPAISTATGAALIWQAGLAAEAEQGPATEPSAWFDPAPTGSRMPNSSAAFLGYVSQNFPAYPAGQDLVFGVSALARPVEPDRATEAEALPIFGSMPTGASVESGGRHATAPVSLQDLPRFVAQLAGTLVHRADGQTDVALSPEELGHVRLSMQADAQNPDRMVVMLTFERPETLDLFRRHADQLADALRAAGYSGSDISFGRSGGDNAHEGTDPHKAGSAAQDTGDPIPGTADTRSHQPSSTVATGSLDLRL